MAKPKDIAKIHVAAVYFAQGARDINEIAVVFDVSTRTVRRWSKEEPAWEAAIATWESRRGGDPVDRSFKKKPKRNARRDTGELFEAAETEYKAAIKRGVASHKLASQTAEKVEGLTRRRVYEWARLYGWLEGNGTDTQEESPLDENEY